MTVSPSASVAERAPTDVVFSSTLKTLWDVITGSLSFKLLIVTVMVWSVVPPSPSEAVTTML